MFRKSALALSILLVIAVSQVIVCTTGFLLELLPEPFYSGLSVECLRDGRVAYQTCFEYVVYDPQGKVIKKANRLKDIYVGQTVMLDLNPYKDWAQDMLPRTGCRLVSRPEEGDDLWFLMRPEDIMEGYNRTPKRLVSYLGPGGFSLEKPRTPFTKMKMWVNYNSPHSRNPWTEGDEGDEDETKDPRVCLLAGDDLFLISTKARTVRKLTSLPEDTQWIGVYDDWAKAEGEDTPRCRGQFIFTASRTRLFKMSMQGERLAEAPLPGDWAEEKVGHRSSCLSFGLLDNGRMALAIRPYDLERDQTEVRVLDDKGKEVKSTVLPNWPAWYETPKPSVAREAVSYATETAKAMPLEWGLRMAFGHPAPEVTLRNGLSLSCGILIACIVGLGCRNRSLPRRTRVFWIVFGFLFALPGLVVYLVVGPRAPMTACPSCGGKRPINLAECPRCKAAFPKPAPTGLEIFDNA